MSVIATLCVSIAAACSSPTENEEGRSAEAQKSGSGVLRTDKEPLTNRFSALEAPLEVRWMSGTYGDARIPVPGPSTYWIDAVITLDDGNIDKLTTAYSPVSSGQTPSVVEGMKEYLPPGPFRTSEVMSAAFNQERWGASAYLDPSSNKLVLVAIGE